MELMNREDIRRWAENHAVAAARELREMNRNPPSSDEAFQAALALLVYDEASNGSPFERNDSVSDRADQAMWDSWTTLRARWNRAR